MRRREFISMLGGAVAAWPLVAHAQQPDQMRRIGVMIALPEGDPELKKWLAAFRQALERLGWSQSRNIHLDYRFTPAGAHAQELAKELLALQPDVILAFSTPVTAAFQRETRTVPIVFIGIADAVGQGFVPSLTHPGGNLTGLTMYEASVTGKWLEMLKEIQPQLARAAFVVNPKTAPYYDFYMRGAKSVAPSLVNRACAHSNPERRRGHRARHSHVRARHPERGPRCTRGQHHECASRSHRLARGAASLAGGLHQRVLRHRRWAHELWGRLGQRVWAGGVLCGPHLARRQP